jgi:hypothetical protein
MALLMLFIIVLGTAKLCIRKVLRFLLQLTEAGDYSEVL